LKFIGTIKSGDGIVAQDFKDDGEIEVYGGNGFMGFTNKFNIDGENIIIGRVGAKCGNVRYVNEPKWISDNALIVKLREGECCEFISMALEAMDLNKLSTSSAQPLITGTKVRNVYLPYPPTIEEQKRIVEHIKTETRALDIAISKAEREIELIKEYREALIAEAVTGKMVFNRI
jgi:type I restriction enzyme S subunit